MVLKRCFIKTLLALIAVCAFIACTNSSDDTGGGNTEGGNTPSVPQVREYTVRFTAGEGGAITAKAGGQNIVSGSKVKKDTLVVFMAEPNGGKAVEAWSITGGSFAQESGTPGSDTAKVNASADINVHVSFKDVTPGKHVVNFSVDGNVEDGSIEAKLSDESVIQSGNEVPDGSTVIFTALPDTANGRKVKGWKITGGSFKSDPGTENSAQVEVTAPISVTLSFEKKSYTVSFGVQGEHGTLSAKKEDNSPFTSGSKASHGEVITFTAVPDGGYITEGWTGAEADAQDTKTARVTVTSDLEVNVTFKPIHANTASYKIEHYKEALDGQYTATPAETDVKTGIVGTAAAVELKSYEGFEKDRQKPENAIISAGAVIKVYLSPCRRKYRRRIGRCRT